MLQPIFKRELHDAQRESIKKLVEKMDGHLKKAGVISKDQVPDKTLNQDLDDGKKKPPLARLKKKKRAILISIKDNGQGMASALATSIPAAYRHT